MVPTRGWSHFRDRDWVLRALVHALFGGASVAFTSVWHVDTGAFESEESRLLGVGPFSGIISRGARRVRWRGVPVPDFVGRFVWSSLRKGSS